MDTGILKIKTYFDSGCITILLNSKWLSNDRAKMFKYFLGLDSKFGPPKVNKNNELTFLEDCKIKKDEFLLFLTFMRCGAAMFESIEPSEKTIRSLLMTSNQIGGCDELDDYINEIACKKINEKKKNNEIEKLKEHNPLCPAENYHHEYIFKLYSQSSQPNGDEWEATKSLNHLFWCRKKKISVCGD